MKKILVIDDEKRIRELYHNLFTTAGFSVNEASDTEQATDLLLKDGIDLVLLDINIPDANSKEMFEIIHEYDPNLKIIICSVYPIEKQKRLIPEANDYYDKSEGSYGLIEKVSEYLL